MNLTDPVNEGRGWLLFVGMLCATGIVGMLCITAYYTAKLFT